MIRINIPANNGDRYIPYSERTGVESTVYFTRDLTEKVGIKLHTGELGMGHDRYALPDIDNSDIRLPVKDAAAAISPFVFETE